MNQKKKFSEILKHFERYLLALIMFTIIVLVTANVIFRFVLSGGFSWSNELVQILFFWTTLLGSAIAFREGSHMGMGLLDNILPEKAKSVLHIFISVACIVYLVVLGTQGGITTLKQMASGQVSASVGTPEWLVTIAIPIGCVFSAIWLIRRIIIGTKELLSKKKMLDKEVE